jgi:hypothetical protein
MIGKVYVTSCCPAPQKPFGRVIEMLRYSRLKITYQLYCLPMWGNKQQFDFVRGIAETPVEVLIAE